MEGQAKTTAARANKNKIVNLHLILNSPKKLLIKFMFSFLTILHNK